MRNLMSVMAILGFAGCEQYYKVDDACFDTLSGGERLPPASRDALARVNCYRRMTGVLKLTGNDQVQIAADGQVDYVLANPDANLLAGSLGAVPWLTQSAEKPGFTGVNLYERLTGDGPGQAAYSFLDPIATETWEFIHVEVADTVEELPSGAEAIDHLMRYPVFRQTVLQPSFVDGAYAERDLPPPWYSSTGQVTTPGGGLATEVNDTRYARVYYFLTLYIAPHTEHTDVPVLLPKRDQVDVPLWSWSKNQNIPDSETGFAKVQISYPITLLMGALDPGNYSPIDTNQYLAQFTGAAIAGAGEFLNVEAVHPGDVAEELWPDGRLQRTTLALYADKPFEPSTAYTVYADYSSPEGDFSFEYSFTTAADDPGLDPNIGRAVSTLPSRSARRGSQPAFQEYAHHASLGGAATPANP